MEAVSEGKTEVVSLLLEARANTDIQNKVCILIVFFQANPQATINIYCHCSVLNGWELKYSGSLSVV